MTTYYNALAEKKVWTEDEKWKFKSTMGSLAEKDLPSFELLKASQIYKAVKKFRKRELPVVPKSYVLSFLGAVEAKYPNGKNA